MIEIIIAILSMIAKIFISFCKFLYPILIATSLISYIIIDGQNRISDKLFIYGVIYFVIAEIIAPLLNI